MKRPGQARRSNWRSVRLTEREQIAQTLQQRHSLQWHGLCIGSLTLLGMLLAAWMQKTLGVHQLSVRYAVTLTVGGLNDEQHVTWADDPLTWHDGMAYEATAFASYVGDGRLESPVHSHAETVSVTATIDEARQQVAAMPPVM